MCSPRQCNHSPSQKALDKNHPCMHFPYVLQVLAYVNSCTPWSDQSHAVQLTWQASSCSTGESPRVHTLHELHQIPLHMGSQKVCVYNEVAFPISTREGWPHYKYASINKAKTVSACWIDLCHKLSLSRNHFIAVDAKDSEIYQFICCDVAFFGSIATTSPGLPSKLASFFISNIEHLWISEYIVRN